MNKKGSGLVVGIIIIVAIAVVAILAFAYMGYLPFNLVGNGDNGDTDQPLGSEYCEYTTGQIVGMFEDLAGKSLNKDIGFSVVNALNMEACGSNFRLPSEIISVYMAEYSGDWYVLVDDTTVRSGYYYRSVLWGNAPLLSNSTLVRGTISGNGISIGEWYGYSTMTITSYGTRSGYSAFVIWLIS